MYQKEATDTWSFDAIDDLEAILSLRSVGIEIPLSEVYEFVEFEAETGEADG